MTSGPSLACAQGVNETRSRLHHVVGGENWKGFIRLAQSRMKFLLVIVSCVELPCLNKHITPFTDGYAVEGEEGCLFLGEKELKRTPLLLRANTAG